MRNLIFRPSETSDTFSILKLHQKAHPTDGRDEVFKDYRRLLSEIASRNSGWWVTENLGQIVAVLSVTIDREQKMAKITRLMVDPDLRDSKSILRQTLRHFIHEVMVSQGDIELIYTTTFSLSLDEQEVTLLEGFRIMGVFPNALGGDNSRLNGLTVFYPKNTLNHKRFSSYALHPAILPFYEIAKRELEHSELLPNLDVATRNQIHPEILEKSFRNLELPYLEIIEAPKWVEKRFQKLKAQRAQVGQFYPFYSPNSVICDPDQSLELYLRINERQGFAAIIGERLSSPAHPVALYQTVSQMLRTRGISYIEVINDAADAFGIECILAAGFTPCCFVPAFKKQGDSRRDYVVFGRSFEYLSSPDLNLERGYIDFFKAYLNLERRNFLGALQSEAWALSRQAGEISLA